MSFLATALRAYSGVGTIELYRKSWRLTDPKGRLIGNNNMLLVSGLKEKMYVVNLDTNHKSQYALTIADAAADDWVVKTKAVSLQGLPNLPFFFNSFNKNLNQNRLITLSEWKEERFVCIAGAEQAGAYGMVYFNGNVFVNHTDWYPTPAELLDNNWYSLDRYAPVTITKELSDSYLDYAMSVIVSRALPDVRDGFKPVHRRVIFAQHTLGNTKQNAFKKSARVVGDVIGKYHPHGDSAVYETIVRMAQPFSLRYPLIDGQGNFGSIDGDNAAAMRYTEVRMENITSHMLTDLPKDTVEWVPNYDGSEQIPDVLPTRFPNLVVNGSQGIAVAMATNMPPHNLTETIKATIALIQNPNITDKELFSIIPAPDFPTGGTIRGLSGAHKAMATGKGRVVITSKFRMEQKPNGIMSIVFSEIPYGANKARIITRIADAVGNKKLEGISNIQDESDREGMRIVITCKRDSNADVVLNNLLSNQEYGLEVGFSVNNMAIVDGLPKLFNMRGLLLEFIKFRREVVSRRTRFEIEEFRRRAHILEGQIAALLNIDIVIDTIKKSADTASAITALTKLTFDGKGIRKILGKYDRIDLETTNGFNHNDTKYCLHPDQAKDIVNMRLARLTGLEKDKVRTEFLQIIQTIAYLWTIVNDINVLNSVIIDECLQTIPLNDHRKTMIDLKEHRVATIEELLPDEPIVVTMSKQGWIKQQDLAVYNAQRRGGRGKTATALKEDDYVRLMITASSHQTIMLLTSLGRIHCVKGHELPSGSGGARGKPVQNHIALQQGEEVTAIIPVREFGDNEFMVIATRQGKIKRTSLDQFSNIRSTGIIAIALNDGDSVIGCKITDGSSEIMLFSSDSKAIRFEEQQVRAMGRQAGGIAGLTLADGAWVSSLVVAHEDGDVLCVCANGYGKRTKVAEFSKHNRGGKGLISINASERNGNFIGAVAVESDSEIMICSDDGIVIRTDSQGIAKTSRNAQGVKLINLAKGARVSAVETINIIDTPTAKAKPLVKKKRIQK